MAEGLRESLCARLRCRFVFGCQGRCAACAVGFRVLDGSGLLEDVAGPLQGLCAAALAQRAESPPVLNDYLRGF